MESTRGPRPARQCLDRFIWLYLSECHAGEHGDRDHGGLNPGLHPTLMIAPVYAVHQDSRRVQG
jgi:hypothetical protein